MMHTISCGTCLIRTSELGGFDILLVRPHADRNRWGIPKGHISEGETVFECAMRETIEETGYTPIIGRELPDVKVKHSKESKTVKSFLAMVDHTFPLLERDDENFAVEWFHYDDLPELHRYQEPLLEAVVAMLKAR